jgi:hypothetical protein
MQNVKMSKKFRKLIKLSTFTFVTYLKSQKQIPYVLSGIKFLNHTNPTKNFDQFYEKEYVNCQYNDEYDDDDLNEISNSENHFTKLYLIPNFFKSLRFNLKYSKEFYNAINDLYFNYVKNLTDILYSESFTSTTHIQSKSSLRKILNENFYKSILFEENSFLFKTKEINSKTKLILHKDEKIKNKFYLDKIFIHCNYDVNAQEKMILDEIENIPNKNLIIFNYKKINSSSDNSENSSSSYFKFLKNIGKGFNFNSLMIDANSMEQNFKNKLIVRFSVWAKISDNIIVDSRDEKELVNSYRIYDDEWHHILLEMEDLSNELNYLDVLNDFSFNGIVNKILNSKNSQDSKNKINLNKLLKIADFDFFMRGNPIYKKRLNFSDSRIYKDEFYFIKRRI